MNSNKKLPLWKRDSPHEFELALFANLQSASFRFFIVATELVAILQFELKYASCRNDSYFLAVTEATVFRRKVNVFLLKAIRRQKVVRQRQDFRKSNETETAKFYRRRMGERTQGSSTFPLFQMSHLVTRYKSDEKWSNYLHRAMVYRRRERCFTFLSNGGSWLSH